MKRNKKTMKFSNTYDEKIMNYTGNNYNEFIALFDNDEVEEMRKYLERTFNEDFSYATEKEVAELVAVAYLKELLIENIRNHTYSGTEHLFKLFYSL